MLRVVATQKYISGHPDVDFCPCCIKFIRRDAEGWEVVDRDPRLEGWRVAHPWLSVQPLYFAGTGLTGRVDWSDRCLRGNLHADRSDRLGEPV